MGKVEWCLLQTTYVSFKLGLEIGRVLTMQDFAGVEENSSSLMKKYLNQISKNVSSNIVCIFQTEYIAYIRCIIRVYSIVIFIKIPFYLTATFE